MLRRLTDLDPRTILLIMLTLAAAADATPDATQMEDKRPPRVVSSRYVRRHSVRPGDRLRLPCPVDANPPALVAWLKDGETVRLGWDRYRVRIDDWSLTVRDVQMDDTGVFTCRATNGFGSVDVTYLVYVSLDENSALPADFDEDFFQEMHQKGVAPVFTRPEQMKSTSIVSLYPGETVRLRCQAVGRPRVQVLWYKDDKMLSSSSSVAASPPASDYYYSDDEYDDDGGGSDAFGVSWSTPKPQQQEHRPSRRPARRRRSQLPSDLTPPQQLQPLPATGERRLNRRPVNGSVDDAGADRRQQQPRPQDAQDDEDDDDDDVEERMTLKLQHVAPSDAGRYTCRVFNKAGSVNFTYTVQVLEPKKRKPTMIPPYPANTTVSAGETVAFRCYVSSSTAPRVQWLRRVDSRSNDVAMTSERGSLMSDAIGQYVVLHASVGRYDVMTTGTDGVFESKLTLDDVTEQHAGMYVCSLATSGGEVTSWHVYLTVLPGLGRHVGHDPRTELSLLVVAVVTVICCVAAVISIAAVCFMLRHRRRHASRHHPKCVPAAHRCTTPLITSFRLPPPPPPPPVPPPFRQPPDADVLATGKFAAADDCYEHHYDVLESNASYYCPGPGRIGAASSRECVRSARCSAALSRTSLHSGHGQTVFVHDRLML